MTLTVSFRAGRPEGRCELAMTADGWRIASRLALVACILSLALALAAAGPEQEDVRVQRFADPPPGSIGLRGEVRYILVRAEVSAILSYVPTSLPSRCASKAAHPRQPRRTGIAARAVARPLSARPPKTPHITLFLADHAQIVARLAGVLGSCANWDGRTGRPVRGALGQFLVDTINRHDLVTEITKVFADRGYRFAARGASMISEAPLPAANNRLVPTDIAYLSFIAELSPETQRRTPWPTQFHRSTC